ncbi:MAG: SDR family NAD(P)-dependent oxidoreductase, partial [Rikenellaceae bacterium]|nr:SDR family NAD(P)-dependent oxidoreductase [Rikenellaceae bacterium]
MMKTALVTGVTSGIGRAVAERLARLGFRLILTGRRKERLESVKREIERSASAEVRGLNFDIRDPDQVAAALDSLPEAWRAVDVLVNNAGLAAGLEPIDQGNLADWNAMIDTNVKGVLYITRIVSQGMIGCRSGHIFNIGSIAGRQVYAGGVVYCASKHAMHALSEGMRIDFLPHGIKVTEIRPGMVNTEFSTVRFHGNAERAENVYKGVDPLTGEDIAAVVEWILSL